MKNFFAIGAAFTGLAVVFGAFGAHALKNQLGPNELAIFETATKYQMYHGLGLMIVNLAAIATKVNFTRACQALTLGTLIFSGSLYALVYTNVKWLGAITPIGGGLMILGWLIVSLKAIKPGSTWL